MKYKFRRFLFVLITIALGIIYLLNFTFPVIEQLFEVADEAYLDRMKANGADNAILSQIQAENEMARQKALKNYWIMRLPIILQIIVHMIAISFAITYMVILGDILKKIFKDFFKRFLKKKG